MPSLATETGCGGLAGINEHTYQACVAPSSRLSTTSPAMGNSILYLAIVLIADSVNLIGSGCVRASFGAIALVSSHQSDGVGLAVSVLGTSNGHRGK